jgi:hypothetical protein
MLNYPNCTVLQENSSSLYKNCTIHAEDFDRLKDFHPDHIADLQKSGLSAATVRELNIHSVPKEHIARHFGYENPAIQSLLCFPYPGVEGFCRDKVFPPLKDIEGHTQRYTQRPSSGVHLYIPPLARASLPDPSVSFYITEGEKKAAKACQEGLPTIALGGLWNWVKDGHPIAELDLVVWRDRRVMLVPDGDVWERHDLLHPVYALGAELEKRGAYIRVLSLVGEGC